MSGRLGIDFGTSNSVVALYDPVSERAHALAIADLSMVKMAGDQEMTVVPSLAHFDRENASVAWYGSQVIDKGLYDHPDTFRWMKRYVGDRTSVARRVGSRRITPLDAGSAFVSALVTSALAESGGSPDEEIAFSAPVESFEHYEAWLQGVSEEAGVRRFRLIDEASAAALGYGAHIQPGDVYLVFDFGGGTLDVSVVRIEEPGEGDSSTSGRRCRVLGKAGAEVGGSSIDGWLFIWVLEQLGLQDSDEDVRRMSSELLVSCELAKETLSTRTSARVSAQDIITGNSVDLEIQRLDFEELLDRHELFTEIDRVLDRAVFKAHDRGFGKDQIKKVLLVGGSSLIPSVSIHVARQFGRDRVMLDRPMEAVALGASAFVTGVDFYDHIQHSYAVRHVLPDTGAYEYRTIVPSGTSYPTDEPLSRMTIKALFEGQDELGVAIFELAEDRGSTSVVSELVFDSSGAARMVEIGVDEKRKRSHFWMNEKNPTFLVADPPAKAGEARFVVEFQVDRNKRLLITAQDLRTRKWVLDGQSVVKLV